MSDYQMTSDQKCQVIHCWCLDVFLLFVVLAPLVTRILLIPSSDTPTSNPPKIFVRLTFGKDFSKLSSYRIFLMLGTFAAFKLLF